MTDLNHKFLTMFWQSVGMIVLLCWPVAHAQNNPLSQPLQPEAKPATQILFSPLSNRLQCFHKPKGDSFYVLSTGGRDFPKAKLSLYQLKPFKLLKTLELPQLPMPFGRYEDAIVLPVENSNNVLIYNIKSVMLFDYEQAKIIRKREFKDISKGVVLKDGRVNVFFKNPIKRSEIGFKVYSAANLNLIDKRQIKGQTFASNYRGNSYSWFSALAGNMVEIPRDMATNPQVVFYDADSLKPSLIINHRDKQRDAMSNQTFYHVSADFSKLYISTLYNHQSEFDFTVQAQPQGLIGVDDNFHISVDLKTKELNFDVPHVPSDAIEMPLGHIYFQGLSESERFVWVDGVFLIDKVNKQIYKFHQFADGEAVIKDFNSDKIMTTPNAIQHLKVKNENGQEQALDKTILDDYQMTIE